MRSFNKKNDNTVNNSNLISNEESKEILIMTIDGTPSWRYELSERFPNDAARNIVAAENLIALAKYVEELPDNDMIFFLCKLPDERYCECINGLIRNYGFQDTSSPEHFIKKLKGELLLMWTDEGDNYQE